LSILRSEHIVKDYPGTRALDDVSVRFESGKVNALLGKNGSGKSTLVKILAGSVPATSGSFYLDDKKLNFKAPSDANKRGIVMVYQEMSLIPPLSVAENIFLGRLPKNKKNLVDWKKTYADAIQMLKSLDVDINPRTPVAHLLVWQQQVVEFCKALSFNPSVLILDEPTSALSQSEVKKLFEVVQRIKKQGVNIIYITHKLQEVFEIADTVTVLRDSKYIDSANLKDLTNADIINMMFGNVERKLRPEDVKAQDEVMLEVKGLTSTGWYEDVSFKLYKGEVLGIAGMLGSGRTELLRGIFGVDPVTRGEVYVKGKLQNNRSPVTMKKVGLGLTPEDRKKDGLILAHSVLDNLNYASMEKTANGWLEDKAKRRKFAQKQIDDLQIKVPNMNTHVSAMSGGNQQKVVVGNWLNNDPDIMMFDEPSRGIDVNSKQQIFQIMWDQAQKGCSSIFVSTELEELCEVCDRILIMHQGTIVGEINASEITVNKLYECCMGGKMYA